MRVLIGNLPADVTGEGLAESLRKVPPVGRIALARRIDGLICKGKPLSAWVALRG